MTAAVWYTLFVRHIVHFLLAALLLLARWELKCRFHCSERRWILCDKSRVVVNYKKWLNKGNNAKKNQLLSFLQLYVCMLLRTNFRCVQKNILSVYVPICLNWTCSGCFAIYYCGKNIWVMSFVRLTGNWKVIVIIPL